MIFEMSNLMLKNLDLTDRKNHDRKKENVSSNHVGRPRIGPERLSEIGEIMVSLFVEGKPGTNGQKAFGAVSLRKRSCYVQFNQRERQYKRDSDVGQRHEKLVHRKAQPRIPPVDPHVFFVAALQHFLLHVADALDDAEGLLPLADRQLQQPSGVHQRNADVLHYLLQVRQRHEVDLDPLGGDEEEDVEVPQSAYGVADGDLGGG